jgi:hypothetical protein
MRRGKRLAIFTVLELIVALMAHEAVSIQPLVLSRLAAKRPHPTAQGMVLYGRSGGGAGQCSAIRNGASDQTLMVTEHKKLQWAKLFQCDQPGRFWLRQRQAYAALGQRLSR